MDGHQKSNLDLHLRATAAVLKGMHGPSAERRSRSRIEADIWAMVGVDYYRVTPTSKTHKTGFNMVKFAFDLAELIAVDGRRHSLPAYEKAISLGHSPAEAVVGLLGQLYLPHQTKSVASLAHLLRRGRSNL